MVDEKDVERLNAIVNETGLYDTVEFIPNCLVQILRNSVTGESSIGFYRDGEIPEEIAELLEMAQEEEGEAED